MTTPQEHALYELACKGFHNEVFVAQQKWLAHKNFEIKSVLPWFLIDLVEKANRSL